MLKRKGSTPRFMLLPDSVLPGSSRRRRLFRCGGTGSSGMRSINLIRFLKRRRSWPRYILRVNIGFVVLTRLAVLFWSFAWGIMSRDWLMLTKIWDICCTWSRKGSKWQRKQVNITLLRNLSTQCYIWSKEYGRVRRGLKEKHVKIHANFKRLLSINPEGFLCSRRFILLQSCMDNRINIHLKAYRVKGEPFEQRIESSILHHTIKLGWRVWREIEDRGCGSYDSFDGVMWLGWWLIIR